MTDLISKKAFGKRLAQKRVSLKLSQSKLGLSVYPELKTVEAARAKIKRLECGKQLPKTREEVMRIADVLGVEWQYLIHGTSIIGTEMRNVIKENKKLIRKIELLEAEIKGIKSTIRMFNTSLTLGQDEK